MVTYIKFLNKNPAWASRSSGSFGACGSRLGKPDFVRDPLKESHILSIKAPGPYTKLYYEPNPFSP